jgi:P-type Mg2+ transporter
MDALCTDKTGTLTMDHVILEKHCDVALKEDDGVRALAYMNSHFQTGLKNVLDRAVLAHTEIQTHAKIPEYAKVDEIPFDFQRRIMSVVVRTPDGKDRIIRKGARGDLPSLRDFRARRQAIPDGSRAHRRA